MNLDDELILVTPTNQNTLAERFGVPEEDWFCMLPLGAVILTRVGDRDDYDIMSTPIKYVIIDFN